MNPPSCQFVKGSKLGGGTYGEVYSVTTLDGRHYAAKFIKEKNIYDSRGLSTDALVEIDTLVRFKYFPGIVQLIDICYQDSSVVILLEKMDGTLRKFLNEQPFSHRLQAANNLLLTLARCLTMFEILHIVHFDIKPENILYQDGPVFKISDFGLSRQVFPYFIYPGEFFTSWYRPPEYLTERIRETFQAGAGDVWTMGLTMADLLAGKAVIHGENSQQILEAIHRWSRPDMTFEQFYEANKNGSISGKIDVDLMLRNRSRSDVNVDLIDPSLIELISEMLHLNPDHRITSAQILDRLESNFTEQDLLPFIPPEYPRAIIPQGVQTITQIGQNLELSRASVLIALEIYTRFLGTLDPSDLPEDENPIIRGFPGDTYALVCLQIAIRIFSSFRTGRLIEAYRKIKRNPNRSGRRTNKWIIPSLEGISVAERDVLRRINFMIYNLNIGPIIDRAYDQQRNLSKIDPIIFDQPLNGWLNLEEPSEINLTPFSFIQDLILNGQVSRYEFEIDLQSMTMAPHHIITVVGTDGQTYYSEVDYNPRTNQIFPT